MSDLKHAQFCEEVKYRCICALKERQRIAVLESELEQAKKDSQHRYEWAMAQQSRADKAESLLFPEDIEAGRVLRGHRKNGCACRFCQTPIVQLPELNL